MSKPIDEFAQAIGRVRDAAIQECDLNLSPRCQSVVARRWRAMLPDGATAEVRALIADCVDHALFQVLRSIDDGSLPVHYGVGDRALVDLGCAGHGELAGHYLGEWRQRFSTERYIDDFGGKGRLDEHDGG